MKAQVLNGEEPPGLPIIGNIPGLNRRKVCKDTGSGTVCRNLPRKAAAKLVKNKSGWKYSHLLPVPRPVLDDINSDISSVR